MSSLQLVWAHLASRRYHDHCISRLVLRVLAHCCNKRRVFKESVDPNGKLEIECSDITPCIGGEFLVC